MYSRFLNLWTVGTNEIQDGISSRKERDMSKNERTEAMDCLRKADGLNNCGAIQVLELFYRFGVGEEAFGVNQDEELANKYLERINRLCRHKNG